MYSTPTYLVYTTVRNRYRDRRSFFSDFTWVAATLAKPSQGKAQASPGFTRSNQGTRSRHESSFSLLCLDVINEVMMEVIGWLAGSWLTECRRADGWERERKEGGRSIVRGSRCQVSGIEGERLWCVVAEVTL